MHVEGCKRQLKLFLTEKLNRIRVQNKLQSAFADGKLFVGHNVFL